VTPRRFLAAGALGLAALAMGVVGSCSSEPGDDEASDPTTMVSLADDNATSAIPTVPPDELETITDGAAGEPNPPLPVDMTPTPFGIGQLASLGNAQIIASDVMLSAGDDSTPGRMDILLRLRNASSDSLTVQAESFRLYAVSGASSQPQNAVGFVDAPIPADTWATGQLTFEIPVGERPVMLVFDGAAYGDRVLSGAIVVGE